MAILSDMRDAAGDEGLFNFAFLLDPDDFDLRVENYERFSFTASDDEPDLLVPNTTSIRCPPATKILMALLQLVSFRPGFLGRRYARRLLARSTNLMPCSIPPWSRHMVRTIEDPVQCHRGDYQVLMTSQLGHDRGSLG